MPARLHLTFIVHGARADNPDLRRVVGWVRERGHAVNVRVTWEPGDGIHLASEAADRGTDVVIACGGDGTLNEVVNGLDGRDTSLGVVPLGTANDFARQTGIPEDADHAMDVILRRKPVRIDTASMNGRRFVNVSTGGVGAEATAETPADFKASLGTLAYAITAVRKLAGSDSARRAAFAGPGFELETDFLAFAVGSARMTGGGTLMTPDASVTDGLLDLCVIEDMSRRDFARLAVHARHGEHVGLPGVHYAQLPWLKVTGSEPLTVNLDGESVQAQVCDYRARRADLLVHVLHLPGEEPEET
jgi:lipid kinase YegS